MVGSFDVSGCSIREGGSSEFRKVDLAENISYYTGILMTGSDIFFRNNNNYTNAGLQ